MLNFIFPKIPKYAIKNYFQIVLLVSTIFKQWLQVLKSVNYIFFTHYIESKILWYVHYVFKIKFYYYIYFYNFDLFYNPKFKKLSNGYDC
jgi:hypothetical protein